MVQHWQMSKCREFILQAEKAGNFKYIRVAKFRPDMLFYPKSKSTECYQKSMYTTTPKQGCLAREWKVAREKMKLVRPKAKDTAWFRRYGIDLAMFGSREIMINRAFVGLDWLHNHRIHTRTHIKVPLDFNPGRWPGCFNITPAEILADESLKWSDESGLCHLSFNGKSPKENSLYYLPPESDEEIPFLPQGELVRIAKTRVGFDIFNPWLFDKLDHELDDLVASDVKRALSLGVNVDAKNALNDQHPTITPYNLLSACELDVPGNKRNTDMRMQMDPFSALPPHWAASLRRVIYPHARAVHACLQMSFCLGWGRSTYGDDSVANFHRSITEEGNAGGSGHDMSNFYDLEKQPGTDK
jgi:hypothetical protein